MKIKIVAVGNLKDEFNRLGAKEYSKRISRFCDFEVKEIGEENTSKNNPSQACREEILRKEGQKIEREIEGAFVAMDIGGKKLTSEDFSQKLDSLFMVSSVVTFVVGGSYGIEERLKQKANLRLSFSDMTFPHGLFRVMLIEQIYRALAIKSNLPYHK